MILPVRPHFLFGKPNGTDPLMHVPIPPRIGNLTLLETFTLLAVCRILDPKRIFEIGTFRGDTTLNLARNTEAEILTLDIDLDLAKDRLDGQERVKALCGHSWHFDFSPWAADVDLVFVDGAHDFESVRRDSETAVKLLSKRAAIVWHDYGNPSFPDVSTYLDVLGRGVPVYWVVDTMLCVHFNFDL